MKDLSSNPNSDDGGDDKDRDTASSNDADSASGNEGVEETRLEGNVRSTKSKRTANGEVAVKRRKTVIGDDDRRTGGRKDGRTDGRKVEKKKKDKKKKKST